MDETGHSEGWEIRSHVDLVVELVIFDLDDEAAYVAGYAALKSLYPGWECTDSGCYGETGVFAVYQPAEMPQEEESG